MDWIIPFLMIFTLGVCVFGLSVMLDTYKMVKNFVVRGRPEMMSTIYGYIFLFLFIIAYVVFSFFTS